VPFLSESKRLVSEPNVPPKPEPASSTTYDPCGDNPLEPERVFKDLAFMGAFAVGVGLLGGFGLQRVGVGLCRGERERFRIMPRSDQGFFDQLRLTPAAAARSGAAGRRSAGRSASRTSTGLQRERACCPNAPRRPFRATGRPRPCHRGPHKSSGQNTHDLSSSRSTEESNRCIFNCLVLVPGLLTICNLPRSQWRSS
jgi:hypothetical protein